MAALELVHNGASALGKFKLLIRRRPNTHKQALREWVADACCDVNVAFYAF